MAYGAHLGSCLVEELSREWTCSDACAVGLHDTIDFSYLVWTDAETDAGSGTDSVG